jgi:HlyD family secretion protein
MINSSGSVILIKTSEAAISSITEFVRTNGKVSPVTEVKISPDVSGEVTRLFVNEGDFIEADSLLLTIRQDPYLLAIKRAEAVLGASKARYEQQVIQFRRCSLDYNRAINLLDSESITQSEVDKIACDLDVSQSMLKNLKVLIL